MIIVVIVLITEKPDKEKEASAVVFFFVDFSIDLSFSPITLCSKSGPFSLFVPGYLLKNWWNIGAKKKLSTGIKMQFLCQIASTEWNMDFSEASKYHF